LIRLNAVSGVVTWAWAQVITMVRMAVFYHFLNAEGYGLWNLAFAILNFFFFYSFGINNAFIKYTAECHATGDYNRLSRLLSTGLAVAIVMGLTVMGALFLLTDFTMQYFNFTAEDVETARFVVQGIGVTTALAMAFGVYKAILQGLQKLHLINTCAIVFLNVEVFLSFALLYLGYGVKALVFVYAVSVVGNMLFMAYYVRRDLPQLRMNPLRAQLSSLREVFSLGGRMQLLGAVSLFAGTLDRIVFAMYNGLGFAGVYAIARTIAERAQGAAHQAFGALSPASADLFARGEKEKLAYVYAMTLRICCLGCAYLFSFIAVNADIVMMIFMGPEDYDIRSAQAMPFLCLALGIHTLTGPGSSMLRGAGMTLRESIYHIITIVLFLVFFHTARLTGQGDYVQVQTYSLALALGSLVFIFSTNRYFSARLLTPFQTMMPIILAGPLLAIATRWAFDNINPGLPFENRWSAILITGIIGTAYTGVFAIAAWYLPGVERNERDQFLKIIPGGRAFAERYLGYPAQ